MPKRKRVLLEKRKKTSKIGRAEAIKNADKCRRYPMRQKVAKRKYEPVGLNERSNDARNLRWSEPQPSTSREATPNAENCLSGPNNDFAAAQSSGGFIENVQESFHDIGDKIKRISSPERIQTAQKSGYDEADEMSSWTKEETFEFVQLYKSYPHLWNKNSDLYQHKQAREYALLNIMAKMGPDKFKSTQDVKVKIKNLRTTYHQVVRKMTKLEQEGFPYKPTLSWFYEFKEIMEAERLEPAKQEPESDCDDTAVGYSEPSTSSHNKITSIYIETMPDQDEDSSRFENSTEAINPLKRIKMEPQDGTDQSYTLSLPETGVVNDEFQMFANNIAAQLRQLPLDRALKMQLEIQQLVAAERMKLYRNSLGDTNQ